MFKTIEKTFKAALAGTLKGLFRGSNVPELPKAFTKILVIRQHNQLGDMICAVPMLRSLRTAFPQAHISLMASPVNYDIMRNLRYVDEVLEFRKSEFTGVGLIPKMINMASDLRSKKFDLAIVPATVSVSFTSGFLALLSGATIRRGVESLAGKENSSSFCFNTPLALNWETQPHRHQTLRNMDILRGLCPVTSDLSPEVTLTNEELREGKDFVGKLRGDNRPVIAFHPGAGKIPNRWPAERFALVAKTLSEEAGASILIVEGPMDEEPVKLMREAMDIPYHMVSRKAVREVAAILSAVDMAIVNDTGIMHVAAAVGTPVLSLFGPTDPEQWAPIDGRSHYIKGRNDDISTIGVDEVLSLAHEMINKSGKR